MGNNISIVMMETSTKFPEIKVELYIFVYKHLKTE